MLIKTLQKSFFGILFLVTIALYNTALAQQPKQETPTGGIEFFHGSWSELLAHAQQKNKPIFVDVYASWCGPCKRMAAQVFTQPAVGNFYNQNYINYKIDAEKGEGPEVAQKFSVNAYPTLLYVNNQGDLIHKIVGGRNPQDLVTEGKRGLVDPAKLKALTQKYLDGNITDAETRDYILTLFLSDKPEYDQVAEKYFGTMKPETFKQPENLELAFNIAVNPNSNAFQRFVQNKATFANTYTNATVDERILTASYAHLESAVKTRNEAQLKKATDLAKSTIDAKKGASQADFYQMQYYEATENWDKYLKSASTFVEKHVNLKDEKSANTLNNIAWSFFEHTNDKKILKKAEKWAAQSVNLDSKFYNNDTYANILAKLGKKKEAIAAAEKAIVLAKQEGVNFKDTKALLDRLITQ